MIKNANDPYTAPWPKIARILSAAILLTILLPSLSAVAGQLDDSYAVPVVVRVPGAAGSDWRTELCVSSLLTSYDLNVEILLIQDGAVTAGYLKIPPGQTFCSEDFLFEWFGFSQWAGGMVVNASADINPGVPFRYFHPSVKVYNLTSQGTYGLSVTPEPVLAALDDIGVNQHLYFASGIHNYGTAGVDGYRAAVGVFNGLPVDQDIAFVVTDAAGIPVWDKVFAVPGSSQAQFPLPKRLTVEGGALLVESLGGPSGRALVHPYATVTDNETGDGRFISADALWSFTDVKNDPVAMDDLLAELRGRVERSVDIEIDSESPDAG